MIKRLENYSLEDTRFHGHYFEATKDDLEKVCGKVMYTDSDIKERVLRRKALDRSPVHNQLKLLFEVFHKFIYTPAKCETCPKDVSVN